MVITLELPIRTHRTVDPLQAYEIRFGALPPWIEEVDRGLARHLTRQAIARGVPLTAADFLA